MNFLVFEGIPETKELKEMMPAILSQVGPEYFEMEREPENHTYPYKILGLCHHVDDLCIKQAY